MPMIEEHEYEVISTYSTDDALEDGVLKHPYPDQWPWLLITQGVHHDCLTAAQFDGRTYDQVLKPLLMDCIMEVQKNMRLAAPEPVCFCVLRYTVVGTVYMKPNDKGGMTVMLETED